MAYFRCTTGGSGKGNTLVVTCADDLAGATITCTNGTKTYTKTCPSTAPYEVTFYGLAAGTWTVSATVSGDTYTTTVVITDYEAELGGFSWRRWVDTASQLDSTDYASLSEVLADEEAVRELCLEHACVDYMASIATANADVETIINNDLFAKWVNNSDYALDFLGANVVIKALMDEADKYFYGEWTLQPQVPKMTSNTAPYGVARNQSSETGYEAYRAFDNNDSTYATGSSTASTGEGPYIAYEFVSPVNIREIYHKYTSGSATEVNIVKYSDDGSTWTSTNVQYSITTDEAKRVKIPNCGSHRYWGVFRLSATASSKMYARTLQFYAYAPKGNVPVMTANNAPYGEASASAVTGGYAAWKAFDSVIDPQDGDGWVTGSTTTPQWIQYKFTNPICAKRAKLVFNKFNTSATVKVSASNDGSTFTDIVSGVTVTATEEKIVSMTSNDNYYLIYRLTITAQTRSSSGSIGQLISLQFYGRELSVSVPKMDTNTTPYGEASASPATSSYPAWKAFDGDDTSFAVAETSASAHPSSIGYNFQKSIVVKFAMLYPRYQNASLFPKNYKIQGSNDGFVSDINTLYEGSTDNANKKYFVAINNANAYKQYRVYDETSASYSGYTMQLFTLQFYGLDYSEREFEEGVTKKWLYDHGLELEEFYQTDSYGAFQKLSDELVLSIQNNSQAKSILLAKNISNLTPYSLMRAKSGDVLSRSSSDDHYGELATYSVNNPTNVNTRTSRAAMLDVNMPNNHGLDISSLATGQYPAISVFESSRAVTFSIKEWWLE